MAEELAIIRSMHVGSRDVGRPVLWFVTETAIGSALQVLEVNSKEALELINYRYDIANMDGVGCIVDRDAGSLVYLRLSK